MEELPSYTNEAREKRTKDELGLEKNTLLRSAWDKATYQITLVEDTYVRTDDGETHLYTNLKTAIDAGNVTVIGKRATN